MPHSSRKHRRPEQRSGGVGRRKGSLSSATTYIVIGIVIAIIIAVGGFYAYNSMRSTTTNGNPQSTALKYANPVTTVILVGETSVTLTMNKSGSSELIYVKIETSMGTMEIDLFPQAAPKTVANFVMLAKSGFTTIWSGTE